MDCGIRRSRIGCGAGALSLWCAPRVRRSREPV